MKTLKILLILLCVAAMSCTQDVTPDDPPITVHDGPSPTSPVSPDDPEPTPDDPNATEAILALYDGVTMRLWDGERFTRSYTGNVAVSSPRTLAVDDVLYSFDVYGEATGSQWLPATPAAVHATGTESRSVSFGEVWTLETIPDDVAYSLGALHENYTRVFLEGEEQGKWYLNQWECVDVLETASGHIIVVDAMGHYHNFTDDVVVNRAYDGGLLIHTFDFDNHTAYFCDETGSYFTSWGLDHSGDPCKWQQAGGTWYTHNGHEWDPVNGIQYAANSMYNWNNYETYKDFYDAQYAERPFPIAGCVRTENGEEVTYWIELVEGYLYRHIPSLDRLDKLVQLFPSPGTRQAAGFVWKIIDPKLIDGKLYYHYADTVKTYDFETGLIEYFSTDQEVIEW